VKNVGMYCFTILLFEVKNELVFSHTTSLLQVPTFNFSFLTFHLRSVVPFCISAVGQSFRSEK